MYITLRGTPKGESTPGAGTESDARRGTSRRARIGTTVLGLGTVSLLTDISSESVAAMLPLYITLVVGLGPLAFGFIDGIYQGISAVVRIAGGRWADRSDRPKWVAFAGYALSAVTRFGLLVGSGFWAITSVVAVDRLGKGLRTGPRDSLIATASDPEHLGRNFGVHRAMDTTGALIGPLLAFAILAMFPIGLGGYQTIFVFSCAFAVMGVAVLALAVPDLRRNRKARHTGRWPRPGRGPARLVRPGPPGTSPPADRRRGAVAGDDRRRVHLPGAAGRRPDAAVVFPVAVRRHQPRLPAAGDPDGQAGRPHRAGAGVRRPGTSCCWPATCSPGSTSAGPLGLALVLLLLGAFYAATDGVLAALASRLVPEASRASGISAAQTVVALARFGASVGFGVLWQFAGLSTAMLVMEHRAGGGDRQLPAWLLQVRTTRPRRNRRRGTSGAGRRRRTP